jgi:hypothetical protein
MGLLDRLRKSRAADLEVSVEPAIVRPGETVIARVDVKDPDGVRSELAVGLRCRRRRHDRSEVYAEWRNLEGDGPWEMPFTVPPDAPMSKDEKKGAHAWRVEVRDRRSATGDALADGSLIVK